jgi:hypothetical protein
MVLAEAFWQCVAEVIHEFRYQQCESSLIFDLVELSEFFLAYTQI